MSAMPPPDSTLASALVGLGQSQAVLQQLTAEVDGRFDALGGVAQALTMAYSSVSERGGKLATAIQDKQGLALAHQFFEKALKVVEANFEQLQTTETELLEAERLLRQAGSSEREFSRQLTTFRCLGTSVRIEAAHLSGNGRGTIRALAATLHELHNDLASMVADQFTDLAAFWEAVQSIRRKLATAQTENRERISSFAAELQETFANINRAFDQAGTYSTARNQQDARIRSHFEQIVVGLQAQDIVRQKLEVVARGGAAILTEPLARESEALFHALAEIETTQLDDAEKQIVNAQSRIALSVRELMAICEEAAASNVRVRADLQNCLELSRTAPRLAHALRQLQDAATATSGIATEISTTIRWVHDRVMHNVGRLSEALRALRLVALNAQVQVAAASQRSALEVLAARTKDTSECMQSIASGLLAIVDGLVERLRRLDDALRELSGKSSREHESLVLEGDLVQAGVRRIESALRESFGALGECIDRLRNDAHSSIANLQNRPPLTTRFARVRRSFAGLLAPTAAAARDPACTSYVSRRLAELRTGYVMRDQRLVHDAATASFLGPPECTSTASISTAEAPAGNVELF